MHVFYVCESEIQGVEEYFTVHMFLYMRGVSISIYVVLFA